VVLCALALSHLAPLAARAHSLRPDLWIADGTVHATHVNGNTLYLGGSFSYVGPATGPAAQIDGVAGTPIASFPKFEANAPDQPSVNVILSDGAGGWYVGGYFHTVGGVSRNHLVHITASNTVDAGFTPNPGQAISALALSGSTLYVGGGFVTFNGSGRLRAAAIDAATGSLLPWNPAPNGAVNAMAVSGSELYVGGAFTTIDGQARNRIASFHASTGVLASWNPNANGSIAAIAPDGANVYVGGAFSSIGGQARAWLAGLDATTGLATTWNPSPSTGVGSGITALLVNGSTVYAAGSFSTIGGQPRNTLAALDAATGAATAWNPNPNALVRSLALSGSTLFIGGDFSTVGGQPRLRFAGVDVATGSPASWTVHSTHGNLGSTISVYAVAASGATVTLGGTLSSIGGALRTNIAALDLTTGAATAWNPGANNQVRAFTSSPSTLYVGGDFTNIGGQARGRVASFDVSSGSLAPWNPNATSGSVNTLARSGATIYAGGSFNTIGGLGRIGMAAIDAATGAVTAWNPGPSGGATLALAVSGSTVYAAGNFTSAGGQPRNFIAALDATTGAATPWNPSANNGVNALVVDGSTIYAGGYFTSIGGQARNRIAALDAATGNATPWNPNANAAVWSLARGGSAVYVGGSFSSIGGQLRNYVAAVDATTAAATTLGPNPYTTVTGITLNDGTAYLNGPFPSVDARQRHYLVGIVTTGTSATLASVPNPSAPGQLVTLTATLTPATVTGTVTFYDGEAVLATASASGGIAVFSTSTLATGTHSLSVGYSGDANHAPCSSPAILHDVKLPTTTSLVSSPNPSWFGQSVTLTATVSPAAATGTVTFYDGVNPIGTGGLSGGTAELITSALTTATHSLSAGYGGDETYLSSASASVSHDVADLTIVASAGPNGGISPDGSVSVVHGGSQAYTITPASCHAIADVLVDGASVGAVGSYTFTNVTTHHTIAASFAVLGPYTIVASAGPGGTIGPSGNVSVACGGSQAFIITPDAGYAIGDVLVDGASVGAVASHGFTNVTAGHTIAASFTATGGPLGAAITGPPAGTVCPIGAIVTFTGTFGGDGPGRTHTAHWMIDNLSVPGTVNESAGTVTATHTFTAAGVYAIQLVVENDLGASATATQVDGNDAMVVVYDPNAGFVTGGGWMTSPAGALVDSPALTGKVNFGFVSKYKKGFTVPTGETQFTLKFTSFEFNGLSYDWLLVTKPKAQCRGTGTINGSGSYGFLLTVLDGDLVAGGGSDRLRMKIWNTAGGQVVYDNQLGAPDSTTPAAQIGGGNIVIHTLMGGGGGGNVPSAGLTLPLDFGLHQNYPNPVRAETRIAFDLPENSEAHLTIFDLQGRVVAELVNDVLPAGRYSATWDLGRRAGEVNQPGVFFYRFVARSLESDRQATLVRKIIVTR
jgi:hypothetical protein